MTRPIASTLFIAAALLIAPFSFAASTDADTLAAKAIPLSAQDPSCGDDDKKDDDKDDSVLSSDPSCGDEDDKKDDKDDSVLSSDPSCGDEDDKKDDEES